MTTRLNHIIMVAYVVCIFFWSIVMKKNAPQKPAATVEEITNLKTNAKRATLCELFGDKEYHELRKEFTEAFLKDYTLKRSLEKAANKVDAKEERQYSKDVSVEMAKPKPFDDSIKAGQIRLLSQGKDPIWVLVLKRWGDYDWITVAFGDIPFPATDEEFFLGGGRAEYLDVLQFWNTRSLGTETLSKSWLVDTISDDELAVVISIWNNNYGGDEECPLNPPSLLARTGIPITETNDIRFDYIDEQLSRFNKIDWEDLKDYLD